MLKLLVILDNIEFAHSPSAHPRFSGVPQTLETIYDILKENRK